MAQKNILLEKQDYIRVITINHPPANAWNLATMEEFEETIGAIEDDRDARVVVITGSGEKCFSAGLDVSDSENITRISPKGRALWTRVDRLSKPIIAAINGHALGGGLELALACHFRIMADKPKAIMGLTELNLGIIPGWGGTQRLSRVVGEAKALDMMLFSKTVTPQQALEIGLVNSLVPPEQLMDVALNLAGKLAERPPIAVSCVLKAMTAGAYDGIEAGLKMEEEGANRVRETKDRTEGFKAFLEKRKPVFTGE